MLITTRQVTDTIMAGATCIGGPDSDQCIVIPLLTPEERDITAFIVHGDIGETTAGFFTDPITMTTASDMEVEGIPTMTTAGPGMAGLVTASMTAGTLAEMPMSITDE